MKNMRQRLTTTLNRLKVAGACEERYKHLVKSLGGVKFDHDAPINLLTILETNGLDDCLWAMCTTSENCEQTARLMAADFAESVLHIYEKEHPNDNRPRAAIKAARRFALGEIDCAAHSAAYSAARSAAHSAAYSAAWSAAWSAAESAAWLAARSAYSAARSAAESAALSAHEKIIRKYLLSDSEFSKVAKQ